MAWTTPQTWTNTKVRRGEMNTHLRDNLIELKYPAGAVYDIKETTDYSTTSTSYTDISATEGKFLHTITTLGDGNGGNGDIMGGLTAAIYSSTAIRIYFRVLLDGVAQNADDGLFVSEGTGLRSASFPLLLRGIAAGEHAIKLQWKVSSGTGVLLANAGTLTRDIKGQFWVREIS